MYTPAAGGLRNLFRLKAVPDARGSLLHYEQWNKFLSPPAAGGIGTFHVTQDMIVDFATATGETSPWYTDEAKAQESEYHGLIAPPTLCNIFINGVSRPDIKLEYGDLGFFAGQAIESLAPIRPGDTLEASTKLKEVYAKTGRSGKAILKIFK